MTSRHWITLTLVIVILAVILLAGCDSAPKHRGAVSQSRCIPVPGDVIDAIRDGFYEPADTITPMHAVPTPRGDAWFVAGRVPGYGVGVWVVFGPRLEPGLTMAVDGVAIAVSMYPGADAVGLNMLTDGAEEAAVCAVNSP